MGKFILFRYLERVSTKSFVVWSIGNSRVESLRRTGRALELLCTVILINVFYSRPSGINSVDTNGPRAVRAELTKKKLNSDI